MGIDEKNGFFFEFSLLLQRKLQLIFISNTINSTNLMYRLGFTDSTHTIRGAVRSELSRAERTEASQLRVETNRQTDNGHFISGCTHQT